MNEDQELLKLAAKAVGFTIVNIIRSVALVRTDYPIAFKWAPLTDNDDAFRLQVELRMHVKFELDGYIPSVTVASVVDSCTVPLGSDDKQATRLAIVRVAAEFGKAMQEIKPSSSPNPPA